MDIAVDIDEQLTTAMVLATQQPAIVRPYFDKNKNYDNLIETLQLEYDASREAFVTWITDGANIRRNVISFFEENCKDITSHHIDHITHLALGFEKRAENCVIDLEKNKKLMKKLVKEITTTVGKSESNKLESIRDIIYAQWEEEIDAYLESATLFRGLAGKYDPDQEIIFTAESSDDIDKFFESVELN